jgi:hypothetical protein
MCCTCVSILFIVVIMFFVVVVVILVHFLVIGCNMGILMSLVVKEFNGEFESFQ